MRALRERPRVTVARLMAVLLVFAAGAAFAAASDSDEGPAVPRATAAALSKAERAADTRARRLAAAGDEAKRLETRRRRSERRLRASAARNRRLKSALGNARRRLRQLQP